MIKNIKHYTLKIAIISLLISNLFFNLNWLQNLTDFTTAIIGLLFSIFIIAIVLGSFIGNNRNTYNEYKDFISDDFQIKEFKLYYFFISNAIYVILFALNGYIITSIIVVIASMIMYQEIKLTCEKLEMENHGSEN